jgi:Histidine kinase-like ATPase domain
MQSRPTDDRSRLVRTRVAADARSAARTRAEFGSWLETHFTLRAELANDLLLAVNEAIANAAEFAYVDASQRGRWTSARPTMSIPTRSPRPSMIAAVGAGAFSRAGHRAATGTRYPADAHRKGRTSR